MNGIHHGETTTFLPARPGDPASRAWPVPAPGFTLIEMAIVLVVIGLVIGAVLKGQDLIQNARAKHFARFVRQAELTRNMHFDRNGKYPGQTAGLNTQFPSFTNSTTIGGATFYVGLGRNGTRDSIVVTKFSGSGYPSGAPTAFTSAELAYATALDAALDGLADGISGRVQALGLPTVIDDNGTVFVSSGTTQGWHGTVYGLVYDQ